MKSFLMTALFALPIGAFAQTSELTCQQAAEKAVLEEIAEFYPGGEEPRISGVEVLQAKHPGYEFAIEGESYLPGPYDGWGWARFEVKTAFAGGTCSVTEIVMTQDEIFD